MAATHNNRGNAYIRNGDIDRAIADYDEALRLNPKYIDAFMNPGVTACRALPAPTAAT